MKTRSKKNKGTKTMRKKAMSLMLSALVLCSHFSFQPMTVYAEEVADEVKETEAPGDPIQAAQSETQAAENAEAPAEEATVEIAEVPVEEVPADAAAVSTEEVAADNTEVSGTDMLEESEPAANPSNMEETERTSEQATEAATENNNRQMRRVAQGMVSVTSANADVKLSEIYLDSNLSKPVGDTTVTADTMLYAQLWIAFKPDEQPNSPQVTYTYAMPDGITLTQPVQGILYDDENNQAGTYQMENDVISFKYGETWLESHTSNIKAAFKFSFKLDSETIGSGGPKTVYFPGAGEATIKNTTAQMSSSKSGNTGNFNESGYVDWSIQFSSDSDIKSLVINDAFQAYSKMQYKKDSFVLHYPNGQTENISSKISFSSASGQNKASLSWGDGQTVVLSKGNYTITYQGTLAEEELAKNVSYTLYKRNQASVKINDIALKDVEATISVKADFLKKTMGDLETTGSSDRVVPWSVVINNSSPRADMSGVTYTDVLTGDHDYSDLKKEIQITKDGVDVSEEYRNYLSFDEGDHFSIRFPEGAGRAVFKITYKTTLGSTAEETGYYNAAAVSSNAGWEANVSAGQKPGVGTGVVKKSIDIQNITMNELAAGGSGEYGQADWSIVLKGSAFRSPEDIVVSDRLGNTENVMWYKTASGKYNDSNKVVPYVTYAEGNLVHGTDFRATFSRGNYNGTYVQYMTIKFKDTEATRQALKGDITIRYSTQSTGTVNAGYHSNTAEISYKGAKFSDTAGYTVDRTGDLKKSVVSFARAEDGTYVGKWDIRANYYEQNGAVNANRQLEGKVVTFEDHLPAGTKIDARTLQFTAYAGQNWTNRVASGNVSLGTTGDAYYTETVNEDTEAANLPYFENIYRTQPVSFDIEIAKYLNDQPLANGSFSFSLTDHNEDHTNLQYLNGDVAVGEEIMNSAVTGADQGIKTLDLSNLLLLKSAGTYHFQVHEILPGGVHASGDYYKKNGYSYDNRTVNVTVTVTDDGKGTLTPSVSYDGVSATNAAFYNKYEAEGIGTIRLEKHISGREWTDRDAFNFTLEAVTDQAPMPLNSTVTATNENRKCTFDDIIIELDDLTNAETDVDGTKYFEYKITEDVPDGVTPKADGTWEYQGMTSAKPVTVRLNVEDLGNGIIKVTYGRAKSNTIDAPDMTNIYKANPATAVLKASKKVTGKDGAVLTNWDSKTFTFVIESTRSTTPLPDDTSITISDQTVRAQAGNDQLLPTGVSEEITYTQPGVYDYVIREQLPEGMTKMQPVDADSLVYDTSEHSAQVVVTDDGIGNLQAEVRYHGGSDDVQPIFYNRYSEDTEYMLQASKELTGRKLRGGEFSFALYKAFTQSADQSPVIDKDFAKDEDGITANFISRATVDSDGHIYFLPIMLSHEEYAAYDKDYDKEASENTLDLYYAAREEAPSGAVVNEDGTWAKQTDEQTGMQNTTGTIYYKVTLKHLPEGEPTEHHEVVLKAIAYSLDGEQWTPAYTKPASDQADEGTWDVIPTFHNAYTSIGRASIDASKHIDGRDWKENDHFVFALTAEGEAPLRTSADGPMLDQLTAVSRKEQRIADFADLVFTQEDLKDAKGNDQDEVTYTYRIHEVEGYATKMEEVDGEMKEIKVPLGGFLYAADQYVTVNLTDQGDGTIKVTYGKNRTNTIENPQFHNLYFPTEVDAQVDVVKTLNGREWLSSDAFTFTLTPDDMEYPMPTNADGEEVKQAVITIDSENLVDDEDGTKKETFPPITFSKVGTYTYSIREEAGTTPGIHYSQTEHSVTVIVTDDGMGRLCAKVLYVGGSRQEPSAFTNTYSAEPVTVVLEGKKTMIGRELFGGHYSFNLYQTPDQSYDLTEEATTLIGNVTVSATGEMEGRSITYTEPGDYYYVAAERVPMDAENPQFEGVSYLQATEEQKQTHGWMFEGVTYSTNYCKIHVEVKDQLDGTMEAQVTYDNSTAVAEQDREEQGKAAFTNSYDAKGSASLEVTKYFENGTLTEGMYTFELKAVEKDIPMPMKTIVPNAGDGKILFGPIDYTLADLGPNQHYREFHYEITEQIPDEKTVVYDPKTITVTVKVDDYGNGILGTTVSYSDDAFTNKKQEPVKVKVPVEKKLTGDKAPKEETFKFILEGINAERKSELSITGEGKGEFEEIVLDQVGTYTYYITEVDTQLEHYTYDQQRYALVVTVKTDDIGNLKSSVELKDDKGNPVNEVRFTNMYKEPDQPSPKQTETEPKDSTTDATTEVTISTETAQSTEKPTEKDTESKKTESSETESQAQNVAT